MAGNNPECKAIKQRFSDIVDDLAANPSAILQIANRLYSSDMIDKKILQDVQETRNSPYERANQIIFAVEAKTKHEPLNTIQSLYESLHKVGLTQTAKSLQETYKKLGGPTLDTPPSPKMSVTPSLSGSQGNSEDFIDSEMDINELVNVVAPLLSNNWRELGLAIGLSQNELDIIEADNNFNQQECCRGMFNTWQARGKPPFMWSELIKITKSEENLHSVSKDINKRKAAIQKHKDKFQSFSQLEDPELADIMHHLGHLIKDKWKPLGSELGLSRSTLAELQSRRESDTNKLMKMFNAWQRQLTSPNNWQTILIALCMPQVNEVALANSIAEKLSKTSK